ncbi:hypothetical protein JTB14_016491 [Gonioctena quinquepunctata]|nr:hypothetical protein JTB14_016491 [Gonioctena quinquepunctata]
MEKYGPSCNGDQQVEKKFITPKRTKYELKKVHPPPEVPVSNRFTVLEVAENTEIPVENTQPQPIQENNHMETMQDMTSNTTSEVKPPLIVIREKKIWPNINETLKHLGIKSVENFNTRDGIRMILPSMDSYSECTDNLHRKCSIIPSGHLKAARFEKFSKELLKTSIQPRLQKSRKENVSIRVLLHASRIEMAKICPSFR